MRISVEWGNLNKTSLVQSFKPGWTWQEFYEVSKEAVELMKTANHTVHIIADFRKSGNLPVGSSALTHARNAIKNLPDNRGTLIVVSESIFIRSMVEVFRPVFNRGIGSKTFATATIEEAYKLITMPSV